MRKKRPEAVLMTVMRLSVRRRSHRCACPLTHICGRRFATVFYLALYMLLSVTEKNRRYSGTNDLFQL